MFPNFPVFKLPEFKVTGKNAYEIRADILSLAKEYVMEDFRYKYGAWEMSVTQDKESGKVITKVEMPTYPGLDQVLDTAQRMYDFVNNCNKK